MERARLRDGLTAFLSRLAYLGFVSLFLVGLLMNSYAVYEIETGRVSEGTNEYVELNEVSAITSESVLQYREVSPSIRQEIRSRTEFGSFVTLFGDLEETPSNGWAEHEFYASGSVAYEITWVAESYYRLSSGTVVYESDYPKVLAALGLHVVLVLGVLGIKTGQRLQRYTLIEQSLRVLLFAAGIGLLFVEPVSMMMYTQQGVNAGIEVTQTYMLYLLYLGVILGLGRPGKRTSSLLGFSAEYAAFVDWSFSESEPASSGGSRDEDRITLDAEQIERLLTGEAVLECLDDGKSVQILVSDAALSRLTDPEGHGGDGDESD